MPVAHYHGIRGFLAPRGYGVEGAEQMAGWRVSPNLALDQRVAERRADSASIVHLGFGETQLPVFEPCVRRLTEGAGRTSYGPVAGAAAVLEAAAGYFSRRRMPTNPDQIVIG